MFSDQKISIMTITVHQATLSACKHVWISYMTSTVSISLLAGSEAIDDQTV